MYHEVVTSPYWIWGIVATLCTVILAFGSGLYVRSFAYELFLISHLNLPSFLLLATGTMHTTCTSSSEDTKIGSTPCLQSGFRTGYFVLPVWR
jgi:hypothetical protein